MKKFVLGVLCGFLLSMGSVVAASETVRTYLTRAVVNLQIHGEERTATADDVTFLTYNDRMYVPLRWFSENMGATVDYMPASYGRLPQVNVYYEEDGVFTISDETGSVSVGRVKVDFGDMDRNIAPSIAGAIKVNKKLAAGKEVVLELIGENGVVVARSEYVLAGGREDYRKTGAKSMGEFVVGEMRSFETFFPFVDRPEHYDVALKIVDTAAWRFKQSGDYAQQETPFDVGLSVDVDLSKPVKKGSVMNFQVMIMNTTDKELKVINAPFEVVIGGREGETWVLPVDPLQNVAIPGNNGAMVFKLPWKASAPAGEYGVELRTPVEIRYEEDGERKTAYANSGVFTNAMFPITIAD